MRRHGATVLPALPHGAAVAVIRLRSLGDTVLSLPALAALKRWRPDLRLVYLVEPAFRPVVEGNPDIAAVVEVASDAAARWRALRQLRRERPQLAVGLHGGFTAAWLARGSGAPVRAHFLGLRHGWAFNVGAPPKSPPAGRRRLHAAEHVASLLEFLGMPPAPLAAAQIAVPAAARAGIRRRLREAGVEGPFAFLNAHPRSFTMRWPNGEYAALAAWLRRRWDLASVHAYAPGTRPDAIEGVVGLSTSIAELVALEAEASLIVGSDGGPIHVGAALGKPTVAIFSSTDSEVWGPWRTPARIVQNPYACNPCRADRCYAFAQPECILSVSAAQVQAAVEALLTAGAAPSA